MKIYPAGPDVFLPDAVGFGSRKAEICARHGLTGLYPLDNAINPSAGDASLRIFAGNEAMMIEADAMPSRVSS
jgi:nucleoside 2-deoxyribosyltransferase